MATDLAAHGCHQARCDISLPARTEPLVERRTQYVSRQTLVNRRGDGPAALTGDASVASGGSRCVTTSGSPPIIWQNPR
jgi:hypothetical protein